jgi:hypothetical protein
LIIGHLIGVLFCIGVPAVVTAIAPVSWVKLQRHEGQVTAHAEVCLMFFIPYSTAEVSAVEHVRRRDVKGKRRLDKIIVGKPDRYRKAEDQGFMVIEGKTQLTEVPATPADLTAWLQQAQAFLKDERASELKLFMPANWTFSIIGGGLVSLLTVLYFGSMAVAAFQWLSGVSLRQRWLREGCERRLFATR